MRIAPPEFHAARVERLRDRLRAESLDSLIVTAKPNIAYLTGFFGLAGLLVVTPEGLRLVVDGRYAEAARLRERELDAINIVILPQGTTYEESLVDEIDRVGGGRVGFESAHVTVAAHLDLARRLREMGLQPELVPTDSFVEQLRARKDAWELATLRDAGSRLSEVAKCIIQKPLSGLVENDFAALIDQQLRQVGFAKPAFDTIVASGPNSAMPHYRAGDRRMGLGDLVVLDFGGVLNGYCVDMTRTVAIGAADPRQRRVLEQVSEAQTAAFKAIAPGEAPETIDERAREVLVRRGLGEAFSHGAGHGLGLEIHERPRVGPRRVGQPQETLEAGMVFTLEPGAYFPGWGGVRIEDDVLVTTTGAEWLTHESRTA